MCIRDRHVQSLSARGKEKVVAELRAIAETVDTIYLATDLDREGEAIAWHLQQVIGGNPHVINVSSLTKLPVPRLLRRFNNRHY